MNDGIREQLSAFVDGELPENEAELLLRRLSQDAGLRRDAAEYLAIGRMIRSEPGLAGADRLHEQIAAEIGNRPVDAAEHGATAKTSRAIRPLAGAAVAAAVALVAIFALQQTPGIDKPSADIPVPVANAGVPNIDVQQERQRQYFRRHAGASSQLGANGMISRVVTLRFVEDVGEDPRLDEADEAGDSEAAETATQL